MVIISLMNVYSCVTSKRLLNSFKFLLVLNTYRNFVEAIPEMEIKHYAEGGVKPELNDSLINLFSMRFCPYAHRAHLTLNAKKVEYNAIFINLASKPQWYKDIFPAARVPALKYKGEILYESLLLADFINEEFPNNPLYPSEPLLKLKDKMLIERFNEVTSACYKVAMVEFNQTNFENLISALSFFEAELKRRNTTYFGGNDRPMMVDYMIWPWFERILSLRYLYNHEAQFPFEKFPFLSPWIRFMEIDPSVQKHYLSPEQHAKHFRLRKANDPGAFDGIY